MWNTIAGVIAAVALALYLLARYRRDREQRRREPERFFRRATEVLAAARLEDTGSIGLPRLTGSYGGHAVQVLPVVDTLATRRLPALWLLVTIQDALPVAARLDLMMRPAGPTTFSNFDLLPITIERPVDFPEYAVLRTDNPEQCLPPHVVQPHLGVFENSRAKELLIAPNGVRIVWLLAEGSRARYGVFREADFGAVDLDPELLRGLLDRLVELRKSILDWSRRRA